MATLRYSSNVLAYDDTQITSDPSKVYVDWSRSITVDVQNPQQVNYTVAPLSSLTVFDGTRSTSISGSTQFNLAISTLSSDRYRFTWSGIGTNPAFRTNRNLTPVGHTITWGVNVNQTASLTSSAVGEFTAVVVGDVLFVPGVTTGDIASPFSVLNEGFWSVIAKDGASTVLQLARPSGTDFSAFGQAVVSTANTNLIAYSSAGVQVGDSVSISVGFSAPVLKTFIVDVVTPTWFEVVSTAALPVAETAVPTATGMIFYTNGKRFIKIEADQKSVVRTNGDSTDNTQLEPWYVGDATFVAEYVKTGPTWSLVVVNKSTNEMSLLVISVQ